MSVSEIHRLDKRLLREACRRRSPVYLPVSVHWLLHAKVRPAMRELLACARSERAGPEWLRRTVRSTWLAATITRDIGAYDKLGLDTAWERRSDFIYHDQIVQVLPCLNETFASADSTDLLDKRSFARRCLAAGLPAAQSLCEFEDGAVTSESCPPADWKFDLFSKLTDLWCGIGAGLWKYEDGRFAGDAGSFTAGELKEHLRDLSRGHAILLQRRCKNHPDVGPISGRALSTARIVTVRPPRGEPVVALAVYRMGIGNSVADNFALGGLAAPVDLATGILGAAVAKSGRGVIVQHPDTGARIEGFKLPLWNEAKQVAIEAHREFLSMPSVGWDVVLGPGGAWLLEGNPVWCVDVLQMSHRKPLADTIVPAVLASYIRQLVVPPR